MKKIIKLKSSDLNKIVNKVLKEQIEDNDEVNNVSVEQLQDVLNKLKECSIHLVDAMSNFVSVDGELIDALSGSNNYGNVDKHTAISIRSMYQYLGKLDTFNRKILTSFVESADSFIEEINWEENRRNKLGGGNLN